MRDASPEPQGGGGGSLLFFSSLVVFSYSLDAVVAGFGWVTTVTAPPLLHSGSGTMLGARRVLCKQEKGRRGAGLVH